MRSAFAFVVLLTFMLAIATGCARQAEITRIGDDFPGPADAYSRLLVVAVSSDPDHQKHLEDEIVNELERRNIVGIPGNPHLTFEDDVPQDQITAYGRKIGAEAILVTTIVHVDASVEVVEGRTRVESECRGGSLVDYFLYDHEIIRAPDSLQAKYDVVVVSSLYDVATRDRVWSIQSTCFDKSSMSEALSDEARIVVRQLRIDELI